jgi:transcriptional regulator with XRE-family HTH domain
MVVDGMTAERGGLMAPKAETPSAEHRRLRGQLRRARDAAKLTQKDVAEALEWSTSKLIRIENGSVGISITDLKALLLHYGITDPGEVDRFVEMARASKKSAWWQEYRSQIGQAFLSFIGLEASAVRVRQYQNLLVPGLLQTESYIGKLAAIGARDEEHARLITEVRVRRQDLINAVGGAEAFFIMDESVLYRRIGDDAVMREQLLRIKDRAEQSNISVQIVPFNAGVHRGMKSSFEIMEISEQPDDYALLLETVYKDQLIPDPNDETREFVQIFFELEKIALPASATPRLIDKRLEEMDNER